MTTAILRWNIGKRRYPQGGYGSCLAYTTGIRGTTAPLAMTLTQADIDAIVLAVWSDPRALTVAKFLGLK